MRQDLLMSILWLAVASVAAQTCRDAKDYYIGSRCYIFVGKLHDFWHAQAYCNEVSATLATVDSALTANFLASHAGSLFGRTNGEFWIGLYRNASGDSFRWDDGTQSTYTNWAAGYPNSLHFVAENIGHGRWLSLGDHHELPYVCSYDPNVILTTPTRPPTTTALPTTVARSTRRPATCPSGFSHYARTDLCYIVVVYGNDDFYPDVPENAPPLTKETQRCSKYRAQLATVHDFEDNYFFVSLYPKGMTYSTVGLRNWDTNSTNGDWRWTDGSPVDFQNYAPTFPHFYDTITQIGSSGFWVTFMRTSPDEGVVCSRPPQF